MLNTTFRIGGRDYSLSLDPRLADRSYPDENYAEWLVRDGRRVIEVTAWKDDKGKFTDGLAELYEDMGCFEDDEAREQVNIFFNVRGSNKDVPVHLIIHYIVKDYQRMFKKHDSLVEEVAKLKERLAKREREIEDLKRMLQSSLDKRKRLAAALKVWMGKNGEV